MQMIKLEFEFVELEHKNERKIIYSKLKTSINCNFLPSLYCPQIIINVLEWFLVKRDIHSSSICSLMFVVCSLLEKISSNNCFCLSSNGHKQRRPSLI